MKAVGPRTVAQRSRPPIAGDSSAASGSLADGALLQRLLREIGVLDAAEAIEKARGMGPEEALDRFRASLLGRGMSRHTIRMYGWAAARMLRMVGRPVADITLEDLDRFRARCRDELGYSAESLNLTTHAIRAFFGSLGLSTAKGLKPPKRPAPLPSYLREDEVAALLDAVKESPRDSALLHVLAFGGLRVGEVRHLVRDDIDLVSGTIRVRGGKGNKDRYVVLDPAAATALERYFEGGAPSTLFGLSTERIETIVRRAGRDAGLGDRAHPHALRHSLATALLRRGCDIRFIQKQLGHASVATTQVYTHVEIGDLRAAYAKARPGFVGCIPERS